MENVQVLRQNVFFYPDILIEEIMMQNVSMPRVCYTANYPDLYQLQIIKMSHELLILVVQHGIISLSGLTAFSNVDKNTFPEALITDILMELTQI